MSDSDSGLLLPNNVYTFQNESSVVSARGPNVNANNINGPRFQNNGMNSTMQMQNNYERQRYVESNYDQQSLYGRSVISQMSIMSDCDMRHRRYNNSYHLQGMSSQRSAFNGRSGSPMSIRTIDSSASVGAAEIAIAFKTGEFNANEMRIIKDAYNKLMKRFFRKNYERKRYHRRFLKHRRRSGEDSGEQGSNSSLSSDDRSNTASNCKENISSCRSNKTDVSQNFKRTIINDVYNFGTNSARSMTNAPVNLNSTQTSINSHKSSITGSNMLFKKMALPANFNKMQRKQAISELPQKTRFENGFLLPSQRFKKCTGATIPENAEKVYHSRRNLLENGEDNKMNSNDKSARNVETDSDRDDIFSKSTKQKVNNVLRKRSIDSVDNTSLPSQKKTKIDSPDKHGPEAWKPTPKDTNLNKDNSHKGNDFIFAKPTLPIRKSMKDQLVSKFKVSSTESLEHASTIPYGNIQHANIDKSIEQDIESEPSNSTQNSTNLSMRPSFIKRKLFTQKLDVSENRNMSTDCVDSPQNSIYSEIQKEKHKARKLQQVTTQSCLSRDMQHDENNLLDLIHKIVPLEQMNVSNQTNKTDLHLSKNNREDCGDKWDVNSIISVRNDEDVSDTYTDEDIFNASIKELAKKEVSKKSSSMKGNKESAKDIAIIPSPVKKQVIKENNIKAPPPLNNKKSCKVLVEKLPINSLLQNQKTIAMDDIAKKDVQKGVKSFWDTDFESDADCQSPSRIGNLNLKENNANDKVHQNVNATFQGCSSMLNSNKPTLINNTMDSLHKFDTTSLRIRSHRSPTRKKLEKNRAEENRPVLFESQSKNQKTLQVSTCKSNPQAKPVENTKETKITHLKHQNKKTPKTQKQASKISQHNDSKESVRELPATKQTKSTKKQFKTGDIEPEIVQCEQGTIKQTKQSNTVQKPNRNDIHILESDHKSKNGKITHCQQKDNNKNQGITDNQLQKIQSNTTNIRDKLSQDDTKNIEQSCSSIKPAGKPDKMQRAKTINQKKYDSSPNKNTMVEENNNRPVRSCRMSKNTTIEENNNRPVRSCRLSKNTMIEENNNRPVRSCRLSERNSSLEISNLTLNRTRTRRSRQIDLSSTSHGNNDKAIKHVQNSKSMLSDISFSLAAEKNAVSKSAMTTRSNSQLCKSKNNDTSDISFSLMVKGTPTPRKVISCKSRVCSKVRLRNNSVAKPTPLKLNAAQSKDIFVSKNELKLNIRNRTNKKSFM